MSASIDLLTLKTPLGTQPFILTGLTGRSALSTCFRYDLTLRSGTAKLDPDSLLHKPVTVTVSEGDQNPWYLNGLVLNVAQKPANSVGSKLLDAQSYWDYELTVVPALHFLGQTGDCRIFQDVTAKDIAETIFGEQRVTDFEFSLNGTLPKLPYTVMYNESYLAFLERLFAAQGLFYFFKHSDGKHQLVIGDEHAFPTKPSLTVSFIGKSATEYGIESWSQIDETAIGKTLRNDYNPETASTAISADTPTLLNADGHGHRKHYRWPAYAADKATAETIGKAEMQAFEVRANLFEGAARIAGLTAGTKFKLDGDPTANGGKTDYIVAAETLTIDDAAGQGGAGGSGIGARLTAFPAATPWRPLPLPKPVVPGMHSAIVVGKSGEEIEIDKLGRIKVQFSWDTRGKRDDKSSCWLRVIQPWAGAGWGAQFIPRIGQEVAVAFLEGDIDRPFVVGAMYNSTNTPIFAPAEQNKSGFRSRSTKNGSTADYNEFSFDDTAGSEVVLLHAQKDHVIEVENDQTMTIDNCRTVTVKKDETITIDGKQTETVKGDRTFEVKGDHSETVQGKQSVKVNNAQAISVMQAVTYESMESITLKVGGNSIKIDQSGVTISGIMVKVNAEAEISTTGAIAKHAGSGMMKLTGGIIMVN